MKPTPAAVIAHINNQIRADNLIREVVAVDAGLQSSILEESGEVMDLRCQVEELRGEISDAEDEISDLKERINDLEIEASGLKEQVKARSARGAA